jgi:hypothetical protein
MFSKPVVLNALASLAPGSSRARSSVVLRGPRAATRFMASITMRPSSTGSCATIAGTASQRSAKMITAASRTAAAGASACAPGAPASALRHLSLSGSRTPKVTSWPALTRALPSEPPTLPAPRIAILMSSP